MENMWGGISSTDCRERPHRLYKIKWPTKSRSFVIVIARQIGAHAVCIFSSHRSFKNTSHIQVVVA